MRSDIKWLLFPSRPLLTLPVFTWRTFLAQQGPEAVLSVFCFLFLLLPPSLFVPCHTFPLLLKMETTKFPKRPTLRWDQHKRLVLCCLYRFFVCNKKETEEIFSYIFRGHLNERGIQGFIPFATLNTQWVWMKKKRDPVWSHVHMNTAFEADDEWKEIFTQIKSAAKTLRFEPRERMEDDTNASCQSPLGSDDERNITSVSSARTYPICDYKLTIHSLRMYLPCQYFPAYCLLQKLPTR